MYIRYGIGEAERGERVAFICGVDGKEEEETERDRPKKEKRKSKPDTTEHKKQMCTDTKAEKKLHFTRALRHNHPLGLFFSLVQRGIKKETLAQEK